MKKTIFLLFSIIYIAINIHAQTLFSNDEDMRRLADRIITLNGKLQDSIHTQSGFTSVDAYMDLFMTAKTENIQNIYSNGDIFDINKQLAINPEYDPLPKDFMMPNVKYEQYTLFQETPFLYEYIGRHHFFINPQASLHTYLDADKLLKTQAAAGIQWRGRYNNRLAYNFSAHYFLQQIPSFVEATVFNNDAFPGVPAYTMNVHNQETYTFPLFNAQVSYDIVPKYVTANAGYGKFFVGDGIRSLILSDNAAPKPYLAFRTKFWKLEYSNLFFKANSQTLDYGLQQAGQHKYVAMHYLSANITPWLNIGLFETITSTREGFMELGYFNPVIMYRAMERSLGSPDKMAIGLTAKAIPMPSVQLYGQFFINEFTAKEFFASNQYLHNKWGAQLGLKYFNVARINNLDFQLEANVLRPYAYQHRSNSNFTHNNQFLAHPLGANLKELVTRLSYRPFTRIGIEGTLYMHTQGKDLNDSDNYGSNPMKNIKDAPNRYGNYIGQGFKVNTISSQITATWEWMPYLYVDLGSLYRNVHLVNANERYAEHYGFIGIRYMMAQRDWAQY